MPRRPPSVELWLAVMAAARIWIRAWWWMMAAKLAIFFGIIIGLVVGRLI